MKPINKQALWIIDKYLNRIVSKDFHSLNLIGEVPVVPSLTPILLLPNHSSWWDGFLVYQLNKHCFNRKLFIFNIRGNNPKVEANIEIGTTLFGDDPSFTEGSLAIYIKRTFGAEGLRHLLAILIGLDDAGRTGEFVWSVNEHLDRLGYKKMQNGTYAYELKQTALEIIKIFTSLFITATNKDKKGTGKITGRRLFYVEGYEKEYKENWLINEKLTVKASDYWYKNSFESSEGSYQQFTKLLKEIVQENHREHALTIYLAPLLAVFSIIAD